MMGRDANPHGPERLARRFHEAYEKLAPQFGYKTRPASAVPWEQVPEANRRLMEATVREAFGELLEAIDAARLLGPARMVLDRCADHLSRLADSVGEKLGDEAARMAQQIVDLIGHGVTDEPPHALVELDGLRDRLAGVKRSLEAILASLPPTPDPVALEPERVVADGRIAALAAAARAVAGWEDGGPCWCGIGNGGHSRECWRLRDLTAAAVRDEIDRQLGVVGREVERMVADG